MKPIIEIYEGQSLAPPGKKGLTAGSGYWVKMQNGWHRIEYVLDGDRFKTRNLHNIICGLGRLFGLRKWPEDFE
jgi:hypothetical protein